MRRYLPEYTEEKYTDVNVKRAESRKLAKIYAIYPCLAFSYYAELDKDKIAESLVATALDLDKYFRAGNKEVDFLKVNKELLPIEVKAKEELSRNELKPFLWFLEKYKLKKGLVKRKYFLSHYRSCFLNLNFDKTKTILAPRYTQILATLVTS